MEPPKQHSLAETQAGYRLIMISPLGEAFDAESVEVAMKVMRRGPDRPVVVQRDRVVGHLWFIEDSLDAIEKLTTFKQCGLPASLK